MHADEYLAAHQPVRYGTPEWERIHQTLRSAQEGYHGFVKDPNCENLGDPGKRRTGGIAAQTVFTTFAYLAANMRKIRTFLANAEPDNNGVLWVDRPKAKDEAAKQRRAVQQAA